MSYGMVQTVFAINLASNGAAGQIDTPANLQSLLSIYLKGGTYFGNYGFYNAQNEWTQDWPGFFKLVNPLMNPETAGGDWSVVWGPCVYTKLAKDATTGTPTNSAFVAYSPSQNSYVVSVAGTNFKSITDWLSEDVNVLPANQVSWSKFNPINLTQLTPSTEAWIDGGSALGVTDLLTQLFDTSQSANCQSLGGFLQNLPNNPDFTTGASLYFSGHSLGGALTQVLPLYLHAALVAVNQGESGKSVWGPVYVLPTAGPTPGNKYFAELFNQTFPGNIATGFSPVPYWNTDVISNLDIVPAAWNNIYNAFSVTPDAAGNYSSFYGMIGKTQISITIPLMDIKLTSLPFGEAMATLVTLAQTFASPIQPYWPVQQYPFAPTQGFYDWSTGSPVWTTYTLPTDADPIETLEALGPYVLYTHTAQYSYYFLGGAIPPTPRQQKSN